MWRFNIYKHTLETKQKIASAQLSFTQEEIIEILIKQNCVPLCKFTGYDGYFIIHCNECKNDYSVQNAKNILKQEIYCYICRKEKRKRKSKFNDGKTLLERCLNICSELNLNFLDKNINNVQEYHNFRCKNGHNMFKPLCEIFRASKKGNNGCKQCAIDKLRHPFNKIKNQYLDLGFEFLDEKFINMNHRHTTKCMVCSFIWKTKPVCILWFKSGCPECKRYFNEKLTGKYLKEILGEVEIERQKCIKYIELKKYIFADYYFEFNNKKYIIEYNGEQHYKYSPFFHNNKKDNFIKQKKRDRELKKYCKHQNIILIVIDGRRYTKTLIYDFLKKRLTI